MAETCSVLFGSSETEEFHTQDTSGKTAKNNKSRVVIFSVLDRNAGSNSTSCSSQGNTSGVYHRQNKTTPAGDP